MSIFNTSKTITELKEKIERITGYYEDLKKERNDLARQCAREIEDKVHTHKLFEQSLRAENQRALDRVELDKEMATQSLRNQVIKVEHEKKTLEKEVTMLRDAFKTLGYDVKDMKELLGKLVDGLITKDTVVNNHVTHGDITKR